MTSERIILSMKYDQFFHRCSIRKSGNCWIAIILALGQIDRVMSSQIDLRIVWSIGEGNTNASNRRLRILNENMRSRRLKLEWSENNIDENSLRVKDQN